MPFYTYILQCADRSYYTGHTDDLEKRIAQHQTGAIRGYTYERRPVELVWVEEFPTRQEALSAEVRIKNWSRVKKEALMAKDWDRLKLYARPPGERHGLADARNSPSTSLGRNEVVVDHPKPVIVLVRPQLGENIGKAARAMLNFGLVELRLVTPRDGWPNPSAGPAAAGADIVLERATVHATLAEAVADCAHVYATTVRKRGVTKPVLTPAEAAGEIHRQPSRSAFVFGPERSGLETDDVALARAIITVPINPEFGSLNLAQAVILCAYEWSKQEALVQPTTEELLPPAPQEVLEGMIGQFEALLEPTGYFADQSGGLTARRIMRTMLTKPGWSQLEVRTMRGMLTHLRRGPRGGPRRDDDED